MNIILLFVSIGLYFIFNQYHHFDNILSGIYIYMMGNFHGNEEFRIFMTYTNNEQDFMNDHFLPWIKDKKSYIEDRTDLYIIPLSLDKDPCNNFGLKFRNVKIYKNSGRITYSSNLIELKIRNGYGQFGGENWAKIISRSISEIVLLEQVEDNQTEINNKKENYHYVQIGEATYNLNLSDIIKVIMSVLKQKNFENNESLVNALKFPLGFAFTHKNRYSATYEDVFIRTVSFRIDANDNDEKGKSPNNPMAAENVNMRSLCVEGDLNEKDVNDLKLKIPNELVSFNAGYPEALRKIFDN
jgi:hypothetical protein